MKPDDRVRVAEIADGDVLPYIELEIASSCGQHKRALYGGSPNNIAVDNALDVFQDGISVITGFRELRISFGSK